MKLSLGSLCTRIRIASAAGSLLLLRSRLSAIPAAHHLRSMPAIPVEISGGTCFLPTEFCNFRPIGFLVIGATL